MDQNSLRNQNKMKTNSSNNSKNCEKFQKKEKKENSLGKLVQNNKFTTKAVPEKQISLYTLIEKNDKCNSSVSTNTSKDNKLYYKGENNDNNSDKEKVERGDIKINTLISNNDSLNSSKSSDIYKQSSFISNNENSLDKKEFKDEYLKGNKMIYSTIPKVIITSKQFMNLNNNLVSNSSNYSNNINSNNSNQNSNLNNISQYNVINNNGNKNLKYQNIYSDSCKSSVNSKNTISGNSYEKNEGKTKYLNNKQGFESQSERKIQTGDFKLKYKTEKCKYWDLYKSCKFGDNVRFYFY